MSRRNQRANGLNGMSQCAPLRSRTGSLVRFGTAIARALALSLVLSMGTAACSAGPPKPPESPLKQAIKDERIDEQDKEDLERRHVAPPPAYGHKIVLATEDNTAQENF